MLYYIITDIKASYLLTVGVLTCWGRGPPEEIEQVWYRLQLGEEEDVPLFQVTELPLMCFHTVSPMQRPRELE